MWIEHEDKLINLDRIGSISLECWFDEFIINFCDGGYNSAFIFKDCESRDKYFNKIRKDIKTYTYSVEELQDDQDD